jgi:cell division protease FtsH
LRPGRFDRQVVVPVPDLKGRRQILEVHTKRTPLGKDVNLDVLARGTPGLTGASLENLVNEAALQAAKQSKDVLSMSDFEWAKDKVFMGRERRTLIMTDDEKRNTAYHEAGHALVGKLLPHADPVHKVTIIPRGRALGVTYFLPETDKISMTMEDALAKLHVALGGRAAEEIVFSSISNGAAGDIKQVTRLARVMVCSWGMSPIIGPMDVGGQEEVFIGREWSHMRDISEDTARLVDEEIRKLIDGALEDCRRLLRKNMGHLHAIAAALLEYETITGEEIDRIMAGETLPADGADGPPAARPASRVPPAEATLTPDSGAEDGGGEDSGTAGNGKDGGHPDKPPDGGYPKKKPGGRNPQA